jgi:hypothetical protein
MKFEHTAILLFKRVSSPKDGKYVCAIFTSNLLLNLQDLYHNFYPDFIFKKLFKGIDLLCLTPLSAIFQLYHGDQF